MQLRSAVLTCLLLSIGYLPARSQADAQSASTPSTTLITVEVSIVEGAYEDVTASGTMETLSLREFEELARDEKLHVLTSHEATVESGQQVAYTNAEDVVIYPTDFRVGFLPGKNPDGSIEPPRPRVYPSDFGTRGIGTQFAVRPEYQGTSGEIYLQFDAEVVGRPLWGYVGDQTAFVEDGDHVPNMPLAYFPTRTVSTNLVVRNGSSTLLCGGMDVHGNVLYIRIRSQVTVGTHAEPGRRESAR